MVHWLFIGVSLGVEAVQGSDQTAAARVREAVPLSRSLIVIEQLSI
jgi:hypothetical protein